MVDLDSEISNNMLENSDMAEYEAEYICIKEYNENMDKGERKDLKLQYVNSVTS